MERRRRLPTHEEMEQTRKKKGSGEMSYGRIWAGHGLGLDGSDQCEALMKKG
jgi:hypothetical protein